MIIIDVGAHDGKLFSLPYAQDSNNVVYAIEPIPELAEVIRSHQLPNIHVLCAAVGEQEGLFNFHLNRDLQTSSLSTVEMSESWKPYAEQLEEVKTIEVPVTRLDTFIQQHSIEEVDLLKVDAKGYGLQVLKSAGNALSVIKNIIVEVQKVPLYVNSSSKKEVLEYLTDRGFRLISSQLQSNDLEENLEFVRVNRYASSNSEPSQYELNAPYIGKIRFPKHDHVGQLVEEGVFEGIEQAFVLLYLRSGDTFFDCGAHVGIFSCVAAKALQGSGRIVGFEPNPACFELYNYNLSQLGFSNFTAIEAGLSDQEGYATLILGKDGLAAFSTFATGEQLGDRMSPSKISVKSHTLDALISDLNVEQVDLAKLDVEGWELQVLNGAEQSIKAGKFPLWMIEFTEENAVAAGSTTQKLRTALEDFGYTICYFDATHFQLVPEPYHSTYPYKNLFAVTDLKQANDRLDGASSTTQALAKDLIHRWDIAMNARRFQGALRNERQISHQTSHQISDQTREQIETMQSQMHELLEAAEARLQLINVLKQAAEARLQLIDVLKQTADERLQIIQEQQQKIAQNEHAIEQLKRQQQQEIQTLRQSKNLRIRRATAALKEQRQVIREQVEEIEVLRRSLESTVDRRVRRKISRFSQLFN
ncbi:MAG: FkbM family methyltransferase [Drouetiella hepatica Uher 2000/2452]|jgi:FkbM family methyltransferase|uniref:FkbM family methyltransferase n=1 Tax=Drouetiella hepatica Uher 2000/2452 TaxID=904376 RepID=A0A951QDM6_9CYAN|nr:FkbM family methyltransferase [Drouetiella hepatica Uher 2000/2452]